MQRFEEYENRFDYTPHFGRKTKGNGIYYDVNVRNIILDEEFRDKYTQHKPNLHIRLFI